MGVTRKHIYEFGQMFFTQLVVYAIYSISTRAIAQGLYTWTFFTDILYGLVAYFFVRKVVKAEGAASATGYTLGGAIGSLLAIFLTKHFFKT